MRSEPDSSNYYSYSCLTKTESSFNSLLKSPILNNTNNKLYFIFLPC